MKNNEINEVLSDKCTSVDLVVLLLFLITSCFGGELGEKDFNPGGLLDNIKIATAKTPTFLLSIY